MRSADVVQDWPYSAQPCGAPHVPVVEPSGIVHGRPEQQSVLVVHAPPWVTQVEPQTKPVSGLPTHGRPQQSALEAHD